MNGKIVCTLFLITRCRFGGFLQRRFVMCIDFRQYIRM